MSKEIKIVEQTTARIKQLQDNGEIKFPANYSPENALKSAYLILQRIKAKDKTTPVLEACTKESIANALLDMVVQGLNPMKKQCYFIPYGNKLELQRSYLGSVAVLKRIKEVKNIFSQCIYKDDKLKYEIIDGNVHIIQHLQEFGNIANENIIGAYCTIEFENGTKATTLMTMDEIKQAWKQSKLDLFDNKGNIKASSTHGKFTQEMAKKTVVNRACKYIISTTDDSDLLLEAINRTTDNEYKNDNDFDTEIEVEATIATEQASEAIDFEDAETTQAEQPEPEPEEITAPF
jgi:recombination protein RecT